MSNYGMEMANFIGTFMESIDMFLMNSAPFAFMIIAILSVLALVTVFVLWVKHYGVQGA